MNTHLKDGGTIRDWQVHHLSYSKDKLNAFHPGRNVKPMMVTGTVVEDKAGRWKPGYHMRSSLVTKLDRKNGILETLNTRYKLTGKEGNDVMPDLGDGVLGLFY